MDGCVLLAVVFALMRKARLLRSTKPSLCYFALNLMGSNFTCYEELNRFLLANFKSLCYFALNLMRKSSLATEG
ncbi:MAG: hypothetical protein IPL33_18080 [Sphingobacteriales bacterium]|nr:hypothetical protein [Sphingobacteriales bacterium]